MMKGIYEKILIFKIFWKFTARQIGAVKPAKLACMNGEMYKYVHYF